MNAETVDLRLTLAPLRSDNGRERLNEWIARRDTTFRELLPAVADYVQALDGLYTTKSGVHRSYFQLRRELLDSPLIQKFEATRKGATALAFAAAEADIREDQSYQARVREAATSMPQLLKLNDSLSIPKYVSKPNFHWLPYVSDEPFLSEFIGAIWDLGTSNMGRSSADDTSYTVGGGMVIEGADYLRELDPQFQPQRILDIGCSAGGSTIALAMEFPDAQVVGIDVSPSMVSYAHARAVMLGETITFAQENAEKTSFEAGSFDLIVSDIVFHELPNHARRAVIAECGRLLSPGGYMAHVEGATYIDPAIAFGHYWRDSAVRTNNEWYVTEAHISYLERYIRESGLQFDARLLKKIGTPSPMFGNLEGGIQLIGARKPE